ncbi:hypothetical protein [Actinomyces glycerinitolerans]|uniref:Uncharacterized protein n=1 Tax=Actinomyces glycerinitolerans TaxID=1892869 RepID=A0A1M4RWH0_9ACTO|nr:hypothetical protein [Actinomyces glycerinitolerans]SHE24312.1 Hypothetical protein ACGLYG10_0512 [Actinomyces glycerinitolerans]
MAAYQNPAAPNSHVGGHNVTDFALAPGETGVYGESFLVSILAPYLKGQLMCSTTRFVYKVPNTLLGIIPIGNTENTIPLSAIAAVSTSSRFKVGRALLALVLAILGFAMIGDSPLGGLLCLLLAVMFALTSISLALVATNHAGGSFGPEVSVLDKAKLEAFRAELQNRVFADTAALQHGQAQDLRMQSLAMQQMQVAQMQQMQQQQMQQQLAQQQAAQAPQQYLAAAPQQAAYDAQSAPQQFGQPVPQQPYEAQAPAAGNPAAQPMPQQPYEAQAPAAGNPTAQPATTQQYQAQSYGPQQPNQSAEGQAGSWPQEQPPTPQTPQA